MTTIPVTTEDTQKEILEELLVIEKRLSAIEARLSAIEQQRKVGRSNYGIRNN